MAKRKVKQQDTESPQGNELQNKPEEGGSVESCSSCGLPLIELPWSRSGKDQRIHILTCDNLECCYYRNPIKTFTRKLEEET